MYYTIFDGEKEYERVVILKVNSVPKDLHELGIKFLINNYDGTELEDSKIKTYDGRKIKIGYMKEEKLSLKVLKILESHGIYVIEIN